MKNVKKIVALLLCAILLVGATIAGTVAYLTDSKTVNNTFTVGNVTITLDETDVDLYGEPVTGAARVTENEYKLIPGHTYVKDPTIHVGAESENCFLFVKVDNQIAGIEAEQTIAQQLAAIGWTLVAGETNVYYYKDVCGKGYNIPVFTQFTVKTDVENTALATYAGKTVVVTAYAIQADGFANAAAAWAAVKTSSSN